MSKIRKYWSVVAVVLIVALGMVIFQPAANPVQASGSAPVIVTNTPLPVQGTVGISGTPTVQVANTTPLPVQGTVGISGTPTVQVANTTPLPVTAADNPANPAFTPVTFLGTVTTDAFGACTENFIPGIGSNQRFVIEYVSANLKAIPGTKLSDLLIKLSPSSGLDGFELAPTYQAEDATSETFIASQTLRLYAGPGSIVQMEAFIPGSAGTWCTFAISGYLVTLP